MSNQRNLVLVAVLAIVVANVCVATEEHLTDDIQQADCPQICPALYAPICGDNGKVVKEFSNTCELKASNCRLQRAALAPYKQTDMAWCSSSLVDNLVEKLGNLDLMHADCLKPCPMVYRPVCAGNNKFRATLSNACQLEHFNCALKNRSGSDVSELLRVLRDGEC